MRGEADGVSKKWGGGIARPISDGCRHIRGETLHTLYLYAMFLFNMNESKNDYFLLLFSSADRVVSNMLILLESERVLH